jgi:type VI secretion system secreted protein VgrG
MSDADNNSQAPRGLLSAVTCVFRCSELPALHWHVLRFTLTEALSEPYRLVLELFTEEAEVDIPTLLGSACVLRIERDGAVRAVHGIVARVSELGVVTERVSLRVELVPLFGLRGQAVDTRFFQEKSVPEIVAEVLEQQLSAAGRELRLDLDAGAYEKREYCVQYRESDLDFVSRLLQEEGIAYRFEHPPDGDGEVLVLVDDTPACPDLELIDGGAQILYAGDSYGTARRQSIENLTPTHALRTTAIVQRDFDWKKPSESPYEHERRTKDPEGGEREVYDHNDRRLFRDDGARRAKRKHEQQAARTRVCHGSGDVIEFIPGRAFELLGHPQHDLDKEHLLIRVIHRGEMPEEDMYAQGAGDRGSRYVNEFECIERDVKWRPEPTLIKPRAPGLQTAIVTGPESEEIHTDEHGRIKVRFHWDRISPFDDTASCWIRVAQRWSGPGWGAMILPRVGMEVLVEFLDGDPDRPVVTGCVYNGHNRPPYPLPDEKTKSTLKSDSSPGGGGFNEIRFEDAKGNEELYIHAQKDMKSQVVRDSGGEIGRDDAAKIGRHQNHEVGVDRTAKVGNNETITVGTNQTISVGSDQSTTVGANQTLSVGANRNVTVGANESVNVASNQTTSVGANMSLSVGAGGTVTVGAAATVSASGALSLTIGGAATVGFGAAHSLTVGAARTTSVGAGDTLTVAGALSITAASITLAAGGSSIEIGPGGVTITTGAIVSISGATVNVNS